MDESNSRREFLKGVAAIGAAGLPAAAPAAPPASPATPRSKASTPAARATPMAISF